MEFGSKYVYNYTSSEEETVSDDEYETGMDATAYSWYSTIGHGHVIHGAVFSPFNRLKYGMTDGTDWTSNRFEGVGVNLSVGNTDTRSA